MILDDIVAAKQKRLDIQKQEKPMDLLMAQTENEAIKPDFFKSALTDPGLSVIAEIKKASPSRGLICKDFVPTVIAKRYEKHGADAISVLTEQDFFLGSNKYLTAISDVVSIPVLRKDFIIDIWQVYESRLIGAHAILLIAAILTQKQLTLYREAAKTLGMCALVEAHNEQELKKALNSGAEIIGINNRNLKTFQVSLDTIERLVNKIPSGKVIVSESGIENGEDARYLRQLDVDAVLIGESLMRAENVQEKLEEIKKAGAHKEWLR